jgi:Na+/proline symporter
MEAYKELSSTAPFQEAQINNEDGSSSGQRTHLFTVFDYGLFCLMLALSAGIGIYFGFFAKRKQNTTTEYLLGGKKMKFFPIAASLIASHINGFTMLAVPAEVYSNGSEYALCVISAVLASSTVSFRRWRQQQNEEKWKI